jgi:hypothetical protein
MIVDIVKNIFFHSNYTVLEENQERIEIYNTQPDKDDYFLIVSCTEVDNLVTLNAQIESEFVERNIFKNLKDKSAVMKNSSVIYLVEVSDYPAFLRTKENDIYDIEESPYYLKKYVFPYTKNQVQLFSDNIDEVSEASVVLRMKEIIEDKKAYLSAFKQANEEDLYSFVLKLYAKIPVTSYNFKPNQKLDEIIEEIETKISEKGTDLEKELFKLFVERDWSVDNILNIQNDILISDDEINYEAENMLERVKEGVLDE